MTGRPVSRYRDNAMPRLVTTNLRFPETTYRELRYQANRRAVPLATLVREAVEGMLPKNRLGRRLATKLKVYAGPEHPHRAQKPAPLPDVG